MNHEISFSANDSLAYINKYATGKKPTDKELKEQLGNARKLYYWLLENKRYAFYWYEIDKTIIAALEISKPTLRTYRSKLQQHNYLYCPDEKGAGWVFIPYPEATPGELPYLSAECGRNRFDNYYTPKYLENWKPLHPTNYEPREDESLNYLNNLAGYELDDNIQRLTEIRDAAQRALDEAIAHKPLEHSDYTKQLIKNFGRLPQEDINNATGAGV